MLPARKYTSAWREPPRPMKCVSTALSTQEMAPALEQTLPMEDGSSHALHATGWQRKNQISAQARALPAISVIPKLSAARLLLSLPCSLTLPPDTDSTPVTAAALPESGMTNRREDVSTQSTGLKTDSWCANSTTDNIACEITPRHF